MIIDILISLLAISLVGVSPVIGILAIFWGIHVIVKYLSKKD